MTSSEGNRVLRPRKNPERTCRTIAEVLAELKRPASKQASYPKGNSKDVPELSDSHPASTDGAVPKKKTRGKVKKPVPQQPEAEPSALSHSPTQTATVNGHISPKGKSDEPAVPIQSTVCLEKKAKRPQKGRKKKGEPLPEKEGGSNVDTNGERLDNCPTASLSETEETPRRTAKVRRCSKRAVELQSPAETSTANHSNATLCPSHQQDTPLPGNLGPGLSTPKSSRRRLAPTCSSTPMGAVCLSPKPADTAGTTRQRCGTANGLQKELQPGLEKRILSDVSPQKTTRPRKPQVPDKPASRQKKELKEACVGPPVKRQRKKRGAKEQTHNQSAHRVRPRFELHDSELQEPESKDTEQNVSSDLSIELSPLKEPEMINHSPSFQDDEEEDEEELPSFLQQTNDKPSSIREGLCVWCKLRKYPYWPAMVKSVNHKNKKASIIFIDNLLFDKKRIRKGFTVSLRTLKPFDCKESDEFVDICKRQENYGAAITWSLELISDYRIRIGCGSFSGSFIEYFTDDISCPVRRRYPEGSSELAFPSQQLLNEEEDGEVEPAEELDEEENQQPDEGTSKKLLPDRSQAARNRANERLVDFIVKKRGAERRLMAVISGQEPSKFLQALQSCSRAVGGLYLEDEEQVDKVYSYLHKLCEDAVKTSTGVENTDRIRFILDVLLPEAIICAISKVDRMPLDKAEEKYWQGPRHSNREREEFDMMIEQQMKAKAMKASPSP
ncbi:hypothetical protein NFI96_015621 [Prochilodus magdalenae]|nr:hypothetical protein NFI96_015621 [Prochilodus magdalenae]